MAAGLITGGQLRSSAWRRLFRDVYVDARQAVDHGLLVRGAALVLPPGMMIAGRSAAYVYGAHLAEPDDPVTVAGPVRWHPGPGIIPIRRSFTPADVRRWQGLPITTPLATAHELARCLPLRDAVVWLDALTRIRHLSRANVLAHVAAHASEQGWRLAHRAVSLCDPRAESPPESIVRLHLTLAGLPRPVPQYHVLHQGEFVARVDLAWPSVKLALEYDGQWHASPGQLGRDRRRIRQLNALGWYVYPVTSADLHHLDDLASTVAGLLAARGNEFKVKTRLSLE